MRRRVYTRRAALTTVGLGAVGAVTAGGSTASAAVEGHRDDERIRFVDAEPESGFNFPYWLATPEQFRAEPVPLLVTMNSAQPGQPLTGGGPDQPPTVAERARSAVGSFAQVGAWASERLGVPQLVPVFPLPDGDPVDRTHKTVQLDRQTLRIEGTDLERIDRQLLAMTDHARGTLLSDHEMHDELLFWGHSSAGQAAEHMAVLHPEEIMAFAASGVNGVVTLPLAELGGHTLNYQIGVADLESITGSPFDAEAFDAVDKFYIQGGQDTSDRLPFDVPEVPNTWADADLYATAKAVYGRDMVEDRFPRCQIAFERAGVSGQFRVYPELTHDPGPLLERAGPDILAFLHRSIEGADVGAFGQRLTLPFDRTVELRTDEPTVGDPLAFGVSGDYPPPEGLVRYTWQLDESRTESGHAAAFTVDEPGTSELGLSMETAHGQATQRGMSLFATESDLGAYRYDVTPPRTPLTVGEPLRIELDVTNVGSAAGDRRLALRVDGESVDARDVALGPAESNRLALSHPVDESGEFDVHVPPAYRETIAARSDSDPRTATIPSVGTPGPSTRGDDETATSASGPGFGLVTALAGLGGAFAYILYDIRSGDG